MSCDGNMIIAADSEIWCKSGHYGPDAITRTVIVRDRLFFYKGSPLHRDDGRYNQR